MTELVIKRFKDINQRDIFYNIAPSSKTFVYVEDIESLFIYDLTKSKWIKLYPQETVLESYTLDLEIQKDSDQNYYCTIPENYSETALLDKSGISHITLNQKYTLEKIIEIETLVDNKVILKNIDDKYIGLDIKIKVKGVKNA
jgi:hypothetical protein